MAEKRAVPPGSLKGRIACAAFCAWLVAASGPLSAERTVLSAADIWESWTYPAGAVRLENGSLHPTFSREQINAAVGAAVRGVGSNPGTAAAVVDGDRRTGWAPDPGDPVEDWWIEIDLGQVLPVQQIRLYFDEKSAPLSFFSLFLSKGERFIDSAGISVENTLIYSHSERFAFNAAHAIEIDLEDELVRIVRIEVSRSQVDIPRLDEIEVEGFGDNISLDLIKKGGSVDVEAAVVTVAGTPSTMFDGDLVSFWQVSPLAKGSSGGETFGDYRIDLGAVYWIDSIWLLGEPIGIPARNRNLYGNFLSYQILYSDGSLAPDGSLAWSGLVAVPPDPENLYSNRDFQHRFPPVAARYLRLYYPTSSGGNIIGGGDWGDEGLTRVLYGLGLVGEFQVFGEGYPARVVLRSPVIDLGEEWNISRLNWRGRVESGAKFLLRSRSGKVVEEESRYFDKNGKEVTQQRWEKLISSFRGPVETNLKPGAGWSPWSEEYLESGREFRSPSPRRYFQLEMEFLAEERLSSASLDELMVERTRPLASQAVGEIFPQQVEPGAPTEFTYFLQPDFVAQNLGFDRLAIEASVPVSFRQLRVDGERVEVDHEETTKGFRLWLPEQIRRSELIEIDFGATVFQNRTRFRSFLELGEVENAVRQQVDPGDGAAHLEGEGDAVTLPIDDTLLSGFELSAQTFTPNGDGRNDELTIRFDVLKLIDPRPIRAAIHDLQGRRVRLLSDASGVAGRYELTWDGRDDGGERVPPGIYLLRLEIHGDSSDRESIHPLGVAY